MAPNTKSLRVDEMKFCQEVSKEARDLMIVTITEQKIRDQRIKVLFEIGKSTLHQGRKVQK